MEEGVKYRCVVKTKKVRVYLDVGSHGHVFMFFAGEIANKYPTLLNVYKTKITKDLIPGTLTYKIKTWKKQ